MSAELIAGKWGFSRLQLDEYAARSHERAAAAIDGGAFAEQIVPVQGVITDEGLRRGTNTQTLGRLNPSFRENGVIHAGNSSQISDGAAAILVTTPERAADPERVNPLGGAVALGHPLGASGAVLMTRMIHHMRAGGLRYGLQTMCEGGGTANATLVELVR